ncbi:SDR family oxidoreductase [Candidatus Albibeggiatoa sp. nov. BB20]|uniref:SDR family oxidoreductase n=1 Tax=Candidatus Albibeggiatoa sp. nov. BB20 TaxID=3162723 RepID=UPI0033659F7B
MELHNKRIVLTGATGGIGQLLAVELVKKGAKLALVGRNAERLTQLQQQLDSKQCFSIVADLNQQNAIQTVQQQVEEKWGGLDILLNNAGKMYFGEFTQQTPDNIQQILKVNLTTPMLLTHALLPMMLKQNSGSIVNIGSVFGGLGFPYYTTYCSSKFALRGFSESLRRELKANGIKVLYIAPRAIKTAMNGGILVEVHKATKTNIDEPETVVAQIIRAIERDKQEVTLGQPESFFMRLNMLLPKWVDGALTKQTAIMAKFAKKAHD